MRAKSLADKYLGTLLDDVLPFWEKHSLDRKQGGYFTCLDRQGRVYDTDKFMWLQARQLWTFSMLYNRLEKRPGWLKVASHGAKFLERHGRDKEGNWYFALDRQGRPSVQPYNIFSDCFAAMGFSQYALVSGDNIAKGIALKTFQNILKRKKNPKGKYSKAGSGARPLQTLVLPMILSNLSQELKWLLQPEVFSAIQDATIKEVVGKCLDRKRLLLFENVNPDGSHPDTFEGRLISPGHGIEAMWFMMDAAVLRNDRALVELCVDTVLSTLEFGWDKKYQGLYYFLDAQGRPLDRLDWDQKLWWVHLETLVALAKAYRLTGRKECLRWFEKVHDYTWKKFPDPRYGEWFGYLDRRGEVLLKAKGGKWKGCFHLPRALFLCSKELS